MIKIMKASAGSGKTFNLAKTYIRLLLERKERYSYRHILAVTFTNKATEEMKSRILKELYVLAKNPEDSPYCTDFLQISGGSLQKLRTSAETALCDILHDYSAFAVSTIDRFFQQTLRAFSREIGHFSSYQVELDKESLVDESVDRVLDSLSENSPELLDWLTKSVMENIREGGRYNLEGNLREVAQSLKSDEHREAVEKYGINEEEAYSAKRLDECRKGLDEVLNSFRRDAWNAAKAFVEAAAANGISREDFSRGSFNQLFSYASDKWNVIPYYPSETIFKKCGDFGSWFRKADRARFSSAENELLPLLQDYCGLFGERYKVYDTASRIAGTMSELRIAGDLYREFDALMKEKNVLSIDDSNLILRRIIDGADAPFIYEKLGVRFENFLLDEFQDTSRIQWENFRPLVRESDSKGFENLLVGDVKQSIYRWRGSDWKMMGGEVQEEFPRCEVQTLDSNYRSLKNIVEFNNGFFKFASKMLDTLLGEDASDSVSGIYSDSSQKVKTSDPAEGFVEIRFCDGDLVPDRVLEAVEKVRNAGAEYGDITVLVRNNAQGSEVAEYLMSNGIGVISDDSLHLKSSVLVRQLVSLLSSVCNGEDSIGTFLAGEMDIDVSGVAGLSIPDTCEHLLRQLRESDTEFFETQVHYIQSFMDLVQDYVALNGNSMDGFLKSWEDSDPKISSPSDPQSVRVMTIHKSKGLEFAYVIFPYSEKTGLFRQGSHWAHPEIEGTEIEAFADGVYDVSFSKPDKDTSLFRKSSAKETNLQFIDNINTYYVALTRAVKGLTVISKYPPKKVVNAAKDLEPCEFNNFSQLLYYYLHTSGCGFRMTEFETAAADAADSGEVEEAVFSKGEMYSFSTMERKNSGNGVLYCGYPSFPLNPSGSGDEKAIERGRLRHSAEALEFFKDEAKASINARMNGTVLHDVLSKVSVVSDLEGAVAAAVDNGDLDKETAGATLDLLAGRLAAHPEWFPENGAEVLVETSLIDTDGKEYRPDRVVIRDGKVTVIDYKFGEKDRRYLSQVSRYAGIYRRMGHSSVSASVWYVIPDEVEKI